MRHAINTALPKAAIPEVGILHNKNMKLNAVITTTFDHLLKSRDELEKVIRLLLPSATRLQKEVKVTQVSIHNVPIKEDTINKVHSKVQFLNIATTLHRA